MGVGGQHHALATLAPARDLVPIVQEVGWALGQVWNGGGKISPPPGFYPQTIQPVVSHYNDCAILAHKQIKKKE
jgi:hypothetical protein